MKRDLSRKFFYFPIKRAAKRPGFRGFKGFKGEGIAAFGGDEYEVSVTGLAFISPVLRDGVPEPLPLEGGAIGAGG